MKILKTPLATALAIGMLATPAIPVAAQADLMEPGTTGGTAGTQTGLTTGSRAWFEGAIRGQGMSVAQVLETDNPRINGELTSTFSYDSYERLGLFVANGTSSLANEGGEWSGTFSYIGGGDDGISGGSPLSGIGTIVMQGEEGYEGLTAYVVINEAGAETTVEAAVFPGEMPELAPTD
jgi:hypothetical protein